MKRVTVVRAHQAAFADPLVLVEGARVSIGREDSEYPGWVWSIAEDGRAGWTPKELLKMEGNQGILLADYDATELTVRVGDELEVLGEESGWVWCRDGAGKLGWVPFSCLGK